MHHGTNQEIGPWLCG